VVSQPGPEIGHVDRGYVRWGGLHRGCRPRAYRRDEDTLGGVYVPSTIGTLLREFTFGHARQLESVLREHLAGLCERVELLPGPDTRAFIVIGLLARPVYGRAEQGASYGHSKIAGKQLLRKGLSPSVIARLTADGGRQVQERFGR